MHMDSSPQEEVKDKIPIAKVATLKEKEKKVDRKLTNDSDDTGSEKISECSKNSLNDSETDQAKLHENSKTVNTQSKTKGAVVEVPDVKAPWLLCTTLKSRNTTTNIVMCTDKQFI